MSDPLEMITQILEKCGRQMRVHEDRINALEKRIEKLEKGN